MKGVTAEHLIESFPHPTIQPIVGQPTYDSIADFHLKLNANAASIHSNRGNGKLGHFFLTAQPGVYDTLSTTTFVPPTNPGLNPDTPDGATGNQISSLRRNHDNLLEEFNTFDQADKALKSLVIATFDEACIRSLRNKCVGFANASTRDIIQHLHHTCASISPQDLNDNDERLKKPYDPNLPFETLVDQIENAVDFAAAGKAPYSTIQIVNAAYNLIFSTGAFTEYCREWRATPEASKSWDSFKVFFRKAHQDFIQTQDLSTAANAGFQANLASERACVPSTSNAPDATFDNEIIEEAHALEAIANLATASATDKATIATLTNTNATLVKEIASLRKEITSLKPYPRSSFPFTHYCWSCGTKSDHPSHKCEKRKPNHQVQATAASEMGGETRVFRSSA